MYMPELEKGTVPKYLVIVKDDLTEACERWALVSIISEDLAAFFWEEIFCRYGAVYQVTTDNGLEVKGAFAKSLEEYCIPHIRISPYNFQANGVVKQGHFTIQEAIVKACETKKLELHNWANYVSFALFADKITAQ